MDRVSAGGPGRAIASKIRYDLLAVRDNGYHSPPAWQCIASAHLIADSRSIFIRQKRWNLLR